jgi:hypothetical protein
MQRLIGLIVVVGLVFWTASWADMEELLAILASDVPEDFGSMVANARDVNGDGYHDLLIGTDIKWFGRAHIYFGGPSFDTIPDITLVARENIRHFGYCVSGAGDVNDDGFYDIMVAAGNEETDRSFVYIFYGGNPMDTVPDLELYEKTKIEGFGWAMSHTGDLNDDGYDDVIVGAPLAGPSGKAYIYHGGNPMDSIPDLILKTNLDWGDFGQRVVALGDVNGDGHPDIGVGDAWCNTSTGMACIYFGGPDMDRIPEFILKGESAHSHFGLDLAGEDLNGDGYSDIIVGARGYALDHGKIYIYRGGPSIPSNPDLTMTGRFDWEELGFNLMAVGDLDGDGYGDFTSGTFDLYNRVYAYYGRMSMDRDMDLVLPDAAGGADYYGWVAACDIDGNGRPELCVGSPRENKVYIYRIRHNQFKITLKPDSRKVVKGEKLSWTTTITNNTGKDQNLYFWVDLLDPNCQPYGDGPVLGPKLEKISASKTVTRHISMEIPGDPSLGQYTCTLKADTTEPQWPWIDFIENDSFEFELVSGMRGFDHPFLSRRLRKR